MLEIVYRVYRWYDRLPEPKRFLYFISAMFILFVGGNINIATRLIMGIVLLFLLLTRLSYLERPKK